MDHRPKKRLCMMQITKKESICPIMTWFMTCQISSLSIPHFVAQKNNYALNYGTDVFGWDYSCYSCSTTPLKITSASQIAIRFHAYSTETGIMRLVKSDTGTASDILGKAQTEGSYIDLPLQWLYSTDYITTLTPCEGVTAGTYYLVWVGRTTTATR